MTRYIDADALKTQWYKINDIDENDRGARFVGYTEITRLIDKAPTADAVEVVRCKDCKHYDEFLVCPLNTFEKSNGTGFCNRGERRE